LRGHYVTAGFFPMFDVPFAAGGGWSSAQDQAQARVVVLSSSLATKLFASPDQALGRTVHLNHTDFRVIGVLRHRYPQPLFYAQAGGHVFGVADQFLLPLQTSMALHFALNDHFHCWGSGGDDRKSDHCTWLQYWVRLATPAKAAAYQR